MVIGTYILIITLNVNGLNAPTKRHKLAEWIQKQFYFYLSALLILLKFVTQKFSRSKLFENILLL